MATTVFWVVVFAAVAGAIATTKAGERFRERQLASTLAAVETLLGGRRWESASRRVTRSACT
jgi:hypothetical protein